MFAVVRLNFTKITVIRPVKSIKIGVSSSTDIFELNRFSMMLFISSYLAINRDLVECFPLTCANFILEGNWKFLQRQKTKVEFMSE